MKMCENGWFCIHCNRVSEHEKIKGVQICKKCHRPATEVSDDERKRLQKKYRYRKDRHINIQHWTPQQAAEFARGILQQFKDMGE